MTKNMTQDELDRILNRGNVRLREATDRPTRLRGAETDTDKGERAIPPVDVPEISEAELQAACERWLRSRGYRSRTPRNIQHELRGKWYLHLPGKHAKGNPIILDFILLNSATGRYVEIELKVLGGRLSPDQRCLVIRKEGAVVWNLEQFKQCVSIWEAIK